eukprot:1125543-Pyramimonas_sp.AAC.1
MCRSSFVGSLLSYPCCRRTSALNGALGSVSSMLLSSGSAFIIVVLPWRRSRSWAGSASASDIGWAGRRRPG